MYSAYLVILVGVSLVVKHYDSGRGETYRTPVYRAGDERPPRAASKLLFLRTGDKRFGGWSC